MPSACHQKTFFWKKERKTKKTSHFLLEKRKWGKENQYGAGTFPLLMHQAPRVMTGQEKIRGESAPQGKSGARKTRMGQLACRF